MKLACSVCVGNRNVPNTVANKRKHVKSTLALCKHPKNKECSILLFSGQNKNGTKYDVKGNLKQVLTRFINEGKATIQFNNPPHDLYIQADVIQLKGFLHLFKRALENKISEKELTLSSLSVTPVKSKDIAPTKLVITKRSEYPIKGFPRTLEALYINDIDRCGLDRGILNLNKLKILDLSHNCIEYLPEEFYKLQNLKELNLSYNNFGKSTMKQWNWIDGNLSKTLLLLNISHNNLKFIPDQIIKLHKLTSLHMHNNFITALPSGIGNLQNLKIFTAADNQLSILPGSIKKLRLQHLDLSNNNFEPAIQGFPMVASPKPLPVCSLKEYAAKKVLYAKILYLPGSIPLTVIKYLDEAKYCVCGKACFSVFVKHSHMLLLSNIAESVSFSSVDMRYVPIDCYFCSLKCLGSAFYNRNRNRVI